MSYGWEVGVSATVDQKLNRESKIQSYTASNVRNGGHSGFRKLENWQSQTNDTYKGKSGR